jgi:two-component system, NtrC family, response regulator AtoC
MRIKLAEETHDAVNGKEPVRATMSVAETSADESGRPRSLHAYRAAAEAHAISRALELVGWNRRRAAEMLRISYRGLLYKIQQYKITAATESGVKPPAGGEQLDET